MWQCILQKSLGLVEMQKSFVSGYVLQYTGKCQFFRFYAVLFITALTMNLLLVAQIIVRNIHRGGRGRPGVANGLPGGCWAETGCFWMIWKETPGVKSRVIRGVGGWFKRPKNGFTPS